ncbi:MAG: thioredoxin [Eubacterium sp.]
MKELIINKENFENEVVNSDKPVLLDFWAEWCGPCRMLSPVVSEIAEKYDGKIKVGKVNVDNETELASAFQIASIPALFVVKNGKIVNGAVGFRSIEQIEAMINE